MTDINNYPMNQPVLYLNITTHGYHRIYTPAGEIISTHTTLNKARKHLTDHNYAALGVGWVKLTAEQIDAVQVAEKQQGEALLADFLGE